MDELDEPAFTPAGGMPVTPREPLDAAGETGCRAFSARRRVGPHERTGTAAGHPGEP